MSNTPDTSNRKILEIFKCEEANNGRIMIYDMIRYDIIYDMM